LTAKLIAGPLYHSASDGAEASTIDIYPPVPMVPRTGWHRAAAAIPPREATHDGGERRVSYLVEVPVIANTTLDGDPAVIRVELRDVDEGLVKVARPGRVIARATQSLDAMVAIVQPVAEAFVTRLRGLADTPDEIKLEFGVTVSAEADLVIANTTGGATFSVSLIWKRAADADGRVD
jgi:hypothetical protein